MTLESSLTRKMHLLQSKEPALVTIKGRVFIRKLYFKNTFGDMS